MLQGVFYGQTTPSQRLLKTEQVEVLADAVAQLPEEQQNAVIFQHLQGKSLSELARLLDRSEAAAAGLLYRGLKKLRSVMSEADE